MKEVYLSYSKFVGEVLIGNSVDIRQVEEDIDQGQVEPPRLAGGDKFELLNNEGRDRDYQVCPVVLPLKNVLEIYLSSAAKSVTANINVVTQYLSIP